MTGLRGEVGQSLCQEFKRRNQKYLRLEDYLSSGNENIKPKRLIHLAGHADESNTKNLINANIDYLEKVIDSLAETTVEEVIFFSSATVYGSQNKEDITELDPMISPSLYGSSKLLGEQMLAKSGLNSLCIRLPGVLEINKSTTFLSKTFDKMRTGSDIHISNGQKIYNNFISVPVLADFLINSKIYLQHDIINLASNKELSLQGIIGLIKKSLDSTSNIIELDEKAEFFNLSIKKSIDNYNFVPGIAEEEIKNWCNSRVQTLEKTSV